MRPDALINWLLPREERFQELIEIDTRNLLTGAKVFHELATSESLEDRRVELLRLKHIEHEGDQITRQVFEAPSRTFITPFDREEIRSIAIDIDDILDDLENQAGAVYPTAFGIFFRRDSGLDALGVLTWKQSYQGLEDACDKCKDFTHVLGNLLINNALGDHDGDRRHPLRRAGLRLPQRLPRRRQLDRDGGLHPRALSLGSPSSGPPSSTSSPPSSSARASRRRSVGG